jgi:hypothetical protein
MFVVFENLQGNEVSLHGLEEEMNLAMVRAAMQAGTLTPLSSARAKNDLKQIARLIYNQEKFSNVYHPKVSQTQ